jgi:hypothetical protein
VLNLLFIAREETNLRELIQDIAASAIRGVQLDIRLIPIKSRKSICPYFDRKA